jgi:hypothetical protein
LFGQLAKGGKVMVTIRDGKPAFDIVPARIPALLPAPGSDYDGLPPPDDDEADDPEDEEFLPEPVA